jgi:hypothetical protein
MHDRGGLSSNGATIHAALIHAALLALLSACSDSAGSRGAPAFALAGDSPMPSASAGTAGASSSPSNGSGAPMPGSSSPGSSSLGNEGNPSVGTLQNPDPGSGAGGMSRWRGRTTRALPGRAAA